MKRNIFRKLSLILLVLFARHGIAQNIAVLNSKDIPPYLDAIDGLKSKLKEYDIKVIGLDGVRENWKRVESAMEKRKYDLLVTVGSLALDTALKSDIGLPIVFTMVLNPDKIIKGKEVEVGGVSMNIDPRAQFSKILESVPQAKNIGVLYHPEKNSDLIDVAKKDAEALGLILVASPMQESKELASSLEKLMDKIDVLWLIADSTVVPPGGGEEFDFIAMRTMEKGIPVVAISEKYLDKGAFMTFSVSYPRLGEITGELITDILLSGTSPLEHGVVTAGISDIEVKRNKRAAALLNLELR